MPVDVVTIGENSLDFVAVVAPGAGTGDKRPLAEFGIQSGGQTATAAVACARLGLRARYLGAFGGDDWGRRLHAALADAGVEVVAVWRPGVTNRLAVVLVDETGERTILEYRDPALALSESEVPASAVADARVLIVDGTSLPVAIRAAQHARDAGVRTIVDVDRVETDTPRLLAAVDVVVAPASFVTAVTGLAAPGAALHALAAACPRAEVVVATMGADGLLAMAAGREFRTPGFRVPVVDTTGAGDAFRAGLAAAWVRGGARADPRLAADVRECHGRAQLPGHRGSDGIADVGRSRGSCNGAPPWPV